MTTTNFNVSLSKSIWSDAIAPIVIPSQINSYTHTIEANGGYKSMDVSFVVGVDEAFQWLQQVGLDASMLSRGVSQSWNGFVNEVELGYGPASIKAGPLLDIANRVRVDYSTIRYNTNPPIGGQTTYTDWADDTDSQDRFPIIEKRIGAGEASSAQAEDVRDTFLSENSFLKVGKDVNFGNANTATVTLRCLGYYEALKFFNYTYITSGGTVDADVQIERVLAADPNLTLDQSFSAIDANSSVTIKEYQDGTRTGETVIADVVAAGDGANRWLFGVYENRVPYYNVIPSTIFYSHYVTDNGERILDVGDNSVDFWNVRPGQWLEFSDKPRASVGAALRSNEANTFIESVTYTMPFSLQIRGSQVDTFTQKLYRLGLGNY